MHPIYNLIAAHHAMRNVPSGAAAGALGQLRAMQTLHAYLPQVGFAQPGVGLNASEREHLRGRACEFVRIMANYLDGFQFNDDNISVVAQLAAASLLGYWGPENELPPKAIAAFEYVRDNLNQPEFCHPAPPPGAPPVPNPSPVRKRSTLIHGGLSLAAPCPAYNYGPEYHAVEATWAVACHAEALAEGDTSDTNAITDCAYRETYPNAPFPIPAVGSPERRRCDYQPWIDAWLRIRSKVVTLG